MDIRVNSSITDGSVVQRGGEWQEQMSSSPRAEADW